MYVVVIGNMVHGVGPFEDHRDARDFEDDLQDHPVWRSYSTHILALRSPHLMADLKPRWKDVRTGPTR